MKKYGGAGGAAVEEAVRLLRRAKALVGLLTALGEYAMEDGAAKYRFWVWNGEA